MPTEKRCRMCDGPMTDKAPRAKYCSEVCRKKFQRHFAAQQKENQRVRYEANSKGGSSVGIPDYVQKAREIVQADFDKAGKLDDEVRELMREEIRAGIRGRVIENVERAAEQMTTMLPLAMARIMQDLDSESWPERSRAYALIMRYGMPLMDAKPKPGQDDTTVTIVHHIPVVETAFGERFTEEYVDQPAPGRRVPRDAPYDPSDPEPWEADWPICDGCKNRVHPDNVKTTKGTTPDGTVRPLCTACDYKKSMTRFARNPSNTMDSEVFDDNRAINANQKLIDAPD